LSKKEQIAFKCSECSELFPKELVDEIMKGKTVLCEKCGFPARFNFTRKDYVEMGSPPIQAPKLKQKQTSAYRKSPKFESPKEIEPPQRPKPYRYEAPSKNESKKKSKTVINIKTPGIKERIPESDITSLKKSIRILNDIAGSPLIVIIGILILAGTLPKAISSMQAGDFYAGIMRIVVNSYRFFMIILLWNLNYRLVVKKVREENYTNLGIDAIVLGLIALPLYGLGTFMLFEGISILLYEIFIRVNNLIDLGKTDKLSQEIFSANIMESTIKIMNQFLVKGTAFLLLYSVIPILKAMRDFIGATPESIGELVFFGVFFGVSIAFLIYVKSKFTKIVKDNPYQEIPDDVIVKCIVFSSFSLIYAGVGSIGLMICILLFTYKGAYRKIKKKLPSIQYVKSSGVDKQHIDPIPEKSLKSTVPFVPVNVKQASKQPESVPKPMDASKKPLQTIPEIRIDDKKARDQLITSLKQSEEQKPATPPGKPPVMKNGNIKDYMDQVFTVLTADIRDRLLKLDIPEDQKWDVIREFVNLKEAQQQKYLEELENVNRVLSEALIKRIQKMKLPIKETNSIIKQLEIMDPKEQVQFVEFLEHSQ
jgi:DNA-directed RNA polymerase subunit RPC12/RpoP